MLINYRNVRITTQFNFICKSDMPGPSQFVQLKDRIVLLRKELKKLKQL